MGPVSEFTSVVLPVESSRVRSNEKSTMTRWAASECLIKWHDRVCVPTKATTMPVFTPKVTEIAHFPTTFGIAQIFLMAAVAIIVLQTPEANIWTMLMLILMVWVYLAPPLLPMSLCNMEADI